MSTDWSDIFDEIYREPGVWEDELAEIMARIRRPLSPEEIAAVNVTQWNPFPADDPWHAAYRRFDPAAWTIPDGLLPPSYLSFLQWSNGGDFRTGERWFHFFPTRELRELFLGYHVPQYLPGALSFASDGGNVLYFFDMRQPTVAGEYPVLAALKGKLGYADSKVIAASFPEACAGTESAEALLGEF